MFHKIRPDCLKELLLLRRRQVFLRTWVCLPALGKGVSLKRFYPSILCLSVRYLVTFTPSYLNVADLA